MAIEPKSYPEEFRRDVVAVARRGEAPLEQIAKHFGISINSVTNWLREADIDEGARPGITTAEAAEIRELKRRNRLLDRKRWATREELRLAIVTRIERTYHRRRRQAALGRLTPIKFETILRSQVAPAA